MEATMVAAPLLTTKLHAPQPRPGLVSRPRLLRMLEDGLQPGKRLLLISAPAGYGKTTLVSSWLQQADVHLAWLSLDESDNDPVRFLQYVVAALQRIIPSMRIDAPDMLQGIQAADGTLMSQLINEAAAHTEPFVLILDDFHCIHAQPILEMLTFLVDHLPPQMHLVLLSRTDPPLPLSRLRTRSQLVDIRAEQLRFKPDEIAFFLNTVMGLRLSADDILAMEARTEGWIAGLQLAALSMQSCVDVHEFVLALTGSHRYIMDYLIEEVLKLQPPAVRSFLLQTAILSRMCGALCSAIVETDTREAVDGQAVLETLEQMNLFLIPLDNERRWYRYHHLFADVLNRRLEHDFPGRLPDLHRRTAQWYEQNGMFPEAIHHALMAGDRDLAAQLVEQNGCLLLMAGEAATLLEWIKTVAVDPLARPWLAVLKAWALALTGRLEGVEQILLPAESVVSAREPTFEVRMVLGGIAGARAYLAIMQGKNSVAARFAQQALDCLPDGNILSSSIRGVATSILGDASWMNGQLDEARAAYMEAAQIGEAAGNSNVVIMAKSNLGDVLLEQGLLHQAARTYTDILQMTAHPDGRRTPLAERACAGMSRVLYEWNQLDAAGRYAQQCVDLCQQWGHDGYRAVGYLMLARLAHARRDLERAQELLRLAEQLASEHPLAANESGWLQCALVRLWIACGQWQKGAQIVQQSSTAVDIPCLRELKHMAEVRLLLAQGDYEAALALANDLLRIAEAAGKSGRAEILVLQALALRGHGDVPQALAAVERAISLAHPEGYVRLFLDEGEPMADLLHRASAHGTTKPAADLLSAIGGEGAAGGPPAQPLPEPLSQRELEVLQRIAAGHSNQDIANRLVISVATVKRHISNIYAKLGVESRTQAVSLSRELRLLD